MSAHSIESCTHLAPRTYALIGLGLLALGLTISGVSGSIYIVGLGRIEPDPEVRELRTWFGVLAILAHAAFFCAGAFLRHDRFKAARRALTALACLLIALEMVTTYTTKVIFAQGVETAASIADGRVQQLQAQIDANRRTAAALREAGEKSSGSLIAGSRADGARSIREAATLDSRNELLIAELDRAQAKRRPTATSVLGDDGMRLLSAASSIAFILAGVTAVSIGGLLIGIARSHSSAERAATATAPAIEMTAPTALAAPIAATAPIATAPDINEPHREDATTAPPYSAARRWAAAGVPAAAIPAAAFAAPVMAVTAPAYQVASYSAPVATAPAQAHLQQVKIERTSDAPAPEVQTDVCTAPEPVQSSETVGAQAEVHPTAPEVEAVAVQSPPEVVVEEDPRYQRILAAVQSGALTPSIRAIQAAERGGTDIVRGYLKRMESDGVLVRAGRGYRLA